MNELKLQFTFLLLCCNIQGKLCPELEPQQSENGAQFGCVSFRHSTAISDLPRGRYPLSFFGFPVWAWVARFSILCDNLNCLLGCVWYKMRPRLIADLQIQSPLQERTRTRIHNKPQSSLLTVSPGLGPDNFKAS